MDVMYIENYSILKDFQLIFQTLGVILKPDSTEAFDDEKHEKQLVFQPANKE
jgi:lipopolysaccharide/colanic/teichoic acid biosynthesis glycosyltransferase